MRGFFKKEDYRKLLLLTFLGLLFSVSVPPAAIAGEMTAVQAEDLSDRKYLPRLLELLRSAKESIEVSQYQILAAPADASHPVTQILQELADAKARGVQVRVLLNSRLDYDAGDTVPLARNLAAVDFMRERGIEVVFADPAQRLHDKVIVVDKRYVIQGSANWTRTALLSNWESSALIDSPQYAKEILQRLQSIPLRKVQSLDALGDEGTLVEIPARFMTDKNSFPEMLEDKDEKIFEFYLWLLKETASSLTLNDETLFRVFRLDPADSQKDKRREAVRLLKKLEEMELIQLNIPSMGADAEVNLQKAPEPLLEAGKKRVRIPASVTLPRSYFDFGYPARLSFAAEFFYLICRLEMAESPSAPWWWRSEEYLSEKYHIHHTTLASGMLELQRENLIEIVRSDAPEGRPFEERLVNRYRVNRLQDPALREEKFRKLEEKFGAEKVNQARRYADGVEEPQDPEAMSLILQWMQAYDPAAVDAAFQQAAAYERNNPRHSLHYVKEILISQRRASAAH